MDRPIKLYNWNSISTLQKLLLNYPYRPKGYGLAYNSNRNNENLDSENVQLISKLISGLYVSTYDF